MIDCKITENYLKEKERMCKGSGGAGCIGCPIFGHCDAHTTEKMQKNIDLVQKWSNEHPIKTYLSDFMEKHPKAMMHKEEKFPGGSCAKFLGYFTGDCKGDCKACWNTPIENTEEVPQ